MLFFNKIKIVNISNILNMLFIENQLINNKAITKQFQNYQLVITININI